MLPRRIVALVRPSRRRPLRAFLTAWAVFALLGAVWAWATPPSASPDEPAHIVRAASVVRGELFGPPSAWGNLVHVPQYVADAHRTTCFAFHPEVPAACPLPAGEDPAATVVAPTSAGLYNPLYYALVGWPSLVFHDAAGLTAMRVASAVLSALFAALAFAVVSTMRQRRLPLLAFAVAATPMLLFLSGTVNPSAVEATAVLAVFCGMLAVTLSPDPALLRFRSTVVAVSAVMAVNARGLSPLWVLAALVVLLLLARGGTVRRLLRRPAVLVAVATVALGTLAAVGWTLSTNSLANAIAHPDDALQFPGVGASPVTGFQRVLLGTVGYSQGLVGLFGWLDTPAPDAVLYAWGVAVGALAIGALLVLRGRRLLVAAVLVGGFLLLPALVQAVYIHGGGMIWQGRYNLPLFLCLVVGLAALLDEDAFRSRQAWARVRILIVGGAVVGQLWAFESVLRRYAVGSQGSMKTFLFGSPAWQPSGGVVTVLIAATIAYAAAAVLLLRAVPRDAAATQLTLVAGDPAARPAGLGWPAADTARGGRGAAPAEPAPVD
ncbi:DUF2142 domain-containing protein [Leifsonia shinshuensis]|uniref:DUF2142 domain-containing protein n=1 Tax=Leifsonia shinshuensis TaxID=150026 RepID=UPI002862DB79|nr:DUF2142 domain-containing protein [Leifsonia shinshuensis]MDR6973256.1 putative membrane protein [Leifsonia shinshuensis]